MTASARAPAPRRRGSETRGACRRRRRTHGPTADVPAAPRERARRHGPRLGVEGGDAEAVFVGLHRQDLGAVGDEATHVHQARANLALIAFSFS
jgi:hypothetical protein